MINEQLTQIENQDKIDNPQDYLYGIHIEQVIKDMHQYPFPGSTKWHKDNPIWDCYVGEKGISPKEAWTKENYIRKAVNNLFKITQTSLYNNKYKSFTDNIYKYFYEAYELGNFEPLAKAVLVRFTVAKIAPKVTAIKASDVLRIIENSGIDISCGVYCPMAGFGGIVDGVKRYYYKYNIIADIEAYDINENFCNYYGWKQRNVLDKVVQTSKVVIVCPPFGKNTERWKDTPDDMYYSFEEWVGLIKKYIIAPNYIFIGPETRTDKRASGLFGKKHGIKFYPEYSL